MAKQKVAKQKESMHNQPRFNQTVERKRERSDLVKWITVVISFSFSIFFRKFGIVGDFEACLIPEAQDRVKGIPFQGPDLN